MANVLEQKPIDYSNMQGFNEIITLLIDFGANLNPLGDGPVAAGQPKKAEVRQGMDMSEKKQALFDLKETLDAGIISQEEFDAEKAKILGA
ncbi:MAG: SHOCT domain-containing protein [Parapedobacter sp.]|nr:MAG: SHOCT domain-containing protein [Parapedobacter sp.]